MNLLELLLSLDGVSLATDGVQIYIHAGRELSVQERYWLYVHKTTLVGMLRKLPRELRQENKVFV